MSEQATSKVSHIEQVQLPENSELIRLGVEAEKFTASNVGRFLLGRALKEAAEATSKIRQLKSGEEDFKAKYDELQAVINRHLDLEKWIREAINVGNQAYEQYEQQFREDEQ